MTVWEVITIVSMALPIIGYIVEGVDVDVGSDVEFWVSWLNSRAEANEVNAAITTYSPTKASVTLEAEAPPDVGPIFKVYDPEVAALLAVE